MAAEASRSSGAADSYIGSLISLTSKSEIRYEGVLFNINTEESSIGLKNVRSFGTEGRKKDGPQIPPNDKVYDYILFRGSDVKDLQVKSGPPASRTTPIHNDPAIIQSHYSRPPPAPTSAPSAGTGTVPDLVSQAAQSGLPKSTFQGGVAMYPPGGLGSWGSSPAPSGANGSGVAMPSMYWQGYYGPTSGLQPHVQQPLFHPPPGMSIPLSHQQLGQYSAMNIPSLPSNASNLPEIPSSLLPPVSLPTAVGSYASLTSNALFTVPSPVQAMTSVSDIAPDLMLNKTLIAPNPLTTMSTNLPLVLPLTTASLDVSTIPVVGNSRPYPGSSLPSQTLLQSVTGIAGPSTPSPIEAITTPTLVTPGQLLQSMPATLPTSQSVPTANKDVEVMQSVLPESSSSAPANTQEPILPLPTPSEHKVTRATLPTRHSHKGRERGRGNGISRTITKFTEDFDFTAMNEKFKKDEVWGHLGKSKAYSEDSKDDVNNLGDDEPEASNPEMKPVYVKDDFFDSLSCNALDRGGRNGRTRFSEQMKLDTETFGDFPRNRGNRGGRGYPRGRGRGSYYGRGYGYVGRGRGQIVSSHAT